MIRCVDLTSTGRSDHCATILLVSWAREDPLNERAFWATIYPKLIPVQLAGDPDNPVGLSLTVSFK